MSTLVVVGLLWSAATLVLALAVGRALRAAGVSAERSTTEAGGSRRALARPTGPLGEVGPDHPIHVDTRSSTWWYVADDRRAATDGTDTERGPA
jgi:hypothetical protein